MAKTTKTKEIAQRIDPAYFRAWHPLRMARFAATWSCVGVAGLWLAIAWAGGDDTVYMAGPVASAHALFEQDCAKCHTEKFGPVYDVACLQCHNVSSHVPVEKGRDPACGTCHAEHRGRETVALVGDGHCNACHEDHQRVTSFANHGEFAAEPRDQFLRFNHKKHLEPDLLEGPLACASCHQPEREGFRAIAFDAHCGRCHREAIDRSLPEEKIPHGHQPAAIRDWIAAAYLRRMPEEAATNAKALLARAEAASDAIFDRERGCLLCHTMDGDRIVPPAVPSNWLPRARFDHRPHQAENCEKCHGMRLNDKAEVLTLPGIATCRECHREEGASVGCVTCHGYHPR